MGAVANLLRSSKFYSRKHKLKTTNAFLTVDPKLLNFLSPSESLVRFERSIRKPLGVSLAASQRYKQLNALAA